MVWIGILIGVCASLAVNVLYLTLLPIKSAQEWRDRSDELSGYWRMNNELSEERNRAILEFVEMMRDAP